MRCARFTRAALLLSFALSVQPLFTAGCMALPDDGMAPPASGSALFSATDNDDDDALDIVFGGDPIVFAPPLAVPPPMLRLDVAETVTPLIPPRLATAADHPPRLR